MRYLRWKSWQLLLLVPVVFVTYSTVFTSSSLPGGELSDTLHQGYPFLSFTEQALDAGHLPHWNPFIFCGLPFYSSFSAPIFYPVRGLLLVLFGPEASVRFLFPVQMLMAGLFAWLFLGAIGTSRWGRTVGALAYALAAWSNTLFYAGHGSKMICWSFLPLLLYSCERWITTRRGTFLGLGGLAVGMQALSSHPQMLLYSAGAAFIWTIFRLFSGPGGIRKNCAPGLLGLTVIILLGIAVGAVQLLPGYNFSEYSARGAGLSLSQASSYSLPPEETLTMAFPRLFGYRHGFDDSTLMGAPLYFGRLGLRLSSEFAGVSVILLAIAAWFASARKYRWPLLTLAVLGLLVSWGGYTPVFGVLYRIVPLFRKLRAPHMAAFITTAAIALSAGLGFDALFRRGSAHLRRFAIAIAVFAGVCLLIFFTAGSLLPGLQSGWWERMGAPGAVGYSVVVDKRVNMATPDFLKAAGAAAVLAGLVWTGRRKGGMGIAIPGAIVSLLIAVELVPVDRDFQVYLDGIDRLEDLLPQSAGISDQVGSGRLLPGGNEYIPLGIRSVSGYHAAKPALAEDLQEAVATGGVPAMRQTAYTLFQYQGETLTYGQVRSAMLEQASTDSGVVAQVEAALPVEPQPRVWIALSWVTVSEEQGIQAMFSGFDGQTTALLYQDPPIQPSGDDGTGVRPTATIETDLPETVVIRTESPSAGILVLADTWYPRWAVTVDGEPTELLRVNHWQRGAVVQAGTHLVEFRFDSSDVSAGLIVSIAGITAVLILFAADFLRRKVRMDHDD